MIPPDSFAQTVTSWNNETYQKGRALIAINPATIMGWLLVNDKELAEKTGIAQNPAGPAGSFAEASALDVQLLQEGEAGGQGPVGDRVLHRSRPTCEKISKSVEGRFVPVYRDHTKTDFWQTIEVRRDAGHRRERPDPQVAGAAAAVARGRRSRRASRFRTC